MAWTIKQVTEKTGFSAETLRYYDREGIFSPMRHENGYRSYDDNDIMILKILAVMKYANFSHAEIKKMERLFTSEPCFRYNEGCKDTINAKIAELNQKICGYQKLIRLMEELLPMVSSANSYQSNEKQIAGFINRIFADIRSAGSNTTDH